MRGKQATKRKIKADPKFNSLVLAKLTNLVMERGKKTIAQKIIYSALEFIREKTKEDPMVVFDRAMKKVGPAVEIRPRRVGGANYQVPFPVKGDRQQALAMRWIIAGASTRKGMPMHVKLAQELMDASRDEGAAIKKKMDVHRMAEANRAFAHFAKYG